MTADLEQQAGLLASERQRSEQLQEEMAELTRQRESLSQELEARELKIVNYEDSLGELQTIVANEREAKQHREENLQVDLGCACEKRLSDTRCSSVVW
jgi:predicted  nucleic acid-binding Zn-ribbon protein